MTETNKKNEDAPDSTYDPSGLLPNYFLEA
jgi:hypothetical protein